MKNSTSASGLLKSSAAGQRGRAGRRIVEQQAGEVERQRGEDVGDRVLVEPHARRRDERQRSRRVGCRPHAISAAIIPPIE